MHMYLCTVCVHASTAGTLREQDESRVNFKFGALTYIKIIAFNFYLCKSIHIKLISSAPPLSVGLHMYVCTYTCIHVYIYIHIYVHIYRHNYVSNEI